MGVGLDGQLSISQADDPDDPGPGEGRSSPEGGEGERVRELWRAE